MPETTTEINNSNPGEGPQLDRNVTHETVGPPDVEPEVESHNSNQNLDGVSIPVPDVLDDALVSTDLEEDVCVDSRHDLAWKAEIFITEDEWNASVSSSGTLDSDALIAATSKKQHTEVKLHQLTAQEKLEFEEAKRKEIDSWLKTNTVQRILRNKSYHPNKCSDAAGY